MTHLHNCQCVMRFIQWAFFTGELPMDSNLQLRIFFFFFPSSNAQLNVRSRPCQTFRGLDPFMNVFSLVRFNSCPRSTSSQTIKNSFFTFSAIIKEPLSEASKTSSKIFLGLCLMFTWRGAPRRLPSFLLPLPPELSRATSGTPRAHN